MNAASLVNINISSQFVKPRLQTFWSVSYQNHQTVDRKRGCVFPSCPFGILENKAPQMASWLVFFLVLKSKIFKFSRHRGSCKYSAQNFSFRGSVLMKRRVLEAFFLFLFQSKCWVFFFKINRQSQRGQFEGTWSLTRVLFLFPFFPPLVLKNIQ